MDNEIINKVIKLYKSGKTCKETANEVGISKAAVYRLIKTIGINRSNSESKIGRKLSEEHKENIRKSTKGICKGIERWNYKKLKEGYEIHTSELLYILGVLYGDGYITSTRKDEIGLQVIDKDFIDEFARCLKSQFGHDATIYEYEPRLVQFKGQKSYIQSKTYTLRFMSVETRGFLMGIKNWDYIFNLSDEHKKSFIRGLWDSEGTIGIINDKYLQIKLRNKDIDLAENYQRLLKEVLNINTTYSISKLNMIDVYFSKTVDVIKFYKEIKPTIKRKKEIIERVLKCNPN